MRKEFLQSHGEKKRSPWWYPLLHFVEEANGGQSGFDVPVSPFSSFVMASSWSCLHKPKTLEVLAAGTQMFRTFKTLSTSTFVREKTKTVHPLLFVVYIYIYDFLFLSLVFMVRFGTLPERSFEPVKTKNLRETLGQLLAIIDSRFRPRINSSPVTKCFQNWFSMKADIQDFLQVFLFLVLQVFMNVNVA